MERDSKVPIFKVQQGYEAGVSSEAGVEGFTKLKLENPLTFSPSLRQSINCLLSQKA